MNKEDIKVGTTLYRLERGVPSCLARNWHYDPFTKTTVAKLTPCGFSVNLVVDAN